MYVAYIDASANITPLNAKSGTTATYQFNCELCTARSWPSPSKDWTVDRFMDHLREYHNLMGTEVVLRVRFSSPKDTSKTYAESEVMALSDPQRCSPHGQQACELCSRIQLRHVGPNGECPNCKAYGATGMHTKSCPCRIDVMAATRDEAIRINRQRKVEPLIRENLAAFREDPTLFESVLSNILKIVDDSEDPA